MYLKQNLPKQNHSSWLFVQKIFKKTKKKLKPKSTKTTAVLLYDFFPIIRIFFVHEQNCLLHSLKFLFFFVNIYSTMMYNIFNATEVKTNIPCK
jgi:hypothetical protein